MIPLLKYKIIFIAMFVASHQLAFAQHKVNVITKTIKKELKQSNKTLIVRGEKATININSSEKESFDIEIKLISKNTNKKDAEYDINIIKYEIKENNNDYTLVNYFSSEKFGKIKSNLSVIYTISVPKNAKLDIINVYGNIYLNNLSSFVKLKNSFGEIHISNATGKQWLNAYYSDIYANNVNFDLNCNADKSDIEIKDASGTFLIKSNYGNLRFSAGKELLGLEIDSKNTTVVFESALLDKYNYAISTTSSKINLPNQWSSKIRKEAGAVLYNQIKNNKNPLIKIATTYCQITILNK